MGFSVIAGTGVLLISGIVAFSIVVVQNDAADDAVLRAEQAAQDAALERRLGSLEVTQTIYQAGPDRLTIDVTNTGETTFATAELDVLLDGVVRTDDVTWLRVGGSDVAYWAPLQELEIRMDGVTVRPDRLSIVTGDGIMDFEVL